MVDKPRGGRPWTADDERRLRELLFAGAGFSEIAPKLGRSAGACREKARELGFR